jgi:hypothetical protein
MADEPLESRAWQRLLLLAALVAPLAATAAPAEADRCSPWAGEPTPLPRVDAADSARARWAELRVTELVERAQLAEPTASVESYRLWRRVLCFDPENKLAWRGLARTRPVRIYRPDVSWGQGAAPASSAVDPWGRLAAPVRMLRPQPRAVERAPAAGEDRRRRALARVTELLREGEANLKAAHFEEALGRTEAARRELDAAGGAGNAGDVRALRARLEVLAAIAQVALGDDAAARRSFGRALEAQPGLELDPGRTSPKVMRALESARGAGEGSP